MHNKNQFGFMPTLSTIEFTYLLRQPMEKYKRDKIFSYIFTTLKKPVVKFLGIYRGDFRKGMCI